MNNHNELIQGTAKKDQEAFKRLYEQTSPKLYSQTLRIMRRKSLADEVLQEAYLKIWNRAESYNSSKGSVMAWMSVITRNTAFDTLRALSSRPEETESSYEGPDFAAKEMSLENKIEHNDQLQWIVERLQMLHPEQIQSILYSYYYGYTHQEVAEIMDKPLGTIKGWIRRGSQKMLNA